MIEFLRSFIIHTRIFILNWRLKKLDKVLPREVEDFFKMLLEKEINGQKLITIELMEARMPLTVKRMKIKDEIRRDLNRLRNRAY